MKKINFLLAVLFYPFMIYAQSLISLSPTTGNAGQTLDITIKGRNTHFGQATNAVNINYTNPATTVQVINDSTLIATITIPSTAYTGDYTFSVENSIDSILYLNNVFHVEGVPLPKLLSITPNNVKAGQMVHIVITGLNTHFSTATSILSIGDSPGNNSNISGVTASSETVIEGDISLGPLVGSADLNVFVQNSIDQTVTLSKGFHINGTPKPELVSISPSIVNPGQTLDVTILAKTTHFRQVGATVTFTPVSGSNSAIKVNLTHVPYDTVVKPNITVPSDAVTGDYKVQVSNVTDGTLTLPGLLHVDAVPFIISPSAAKTGDTVNVVITGIKTHFKSSATVLEFPQTGNFTVENITAVADTCLTARVIISKLTTTGDYDVSITNSIDGKIQLSNGFHVIGVSVASIVYVNPQGAKPGKTLDVLIVGTRSHFKTNGTTVNFDFKQANGTTIVNSINAENDSVMHVNITIPSATVPGNYTFSVTNSFDGQLKSNFKVYSDCFAHYTTTYDAVKNSFTLTLDSATTDAISFYWNFGDGTISSDKLPSHVFASDTLYNVCVKIISSALDTCEFCHVMGLDSLGHPIFKKKKGFSISVLPYKSIVTGLTPISNENQIQVYPNPANSMITIAFTNSLTIADKPVLSVYSTAGKLLIQQELLKDKTDINIDKLAPGIYIIRLLDEGQSKMIKFIKE